ncbi:hypothetical protein GCM10020001_063190 [Nonomuraea salmonea]
MRPGPADSRTLPEAFLEQVAATPGAVAVTDGGRHLTYAELNARANRLAHRLRGAGVGAGSLVGVCLDRSAELVVTLLAVLKAGGAYLPLDPAYPADRLAFMVSDAGAPVVVTRSEHLELVERVHGGEVIVLDRDAAAIESHPDTDLGPASVPGDLIYVIYTSGSTGRPKGMCLTHANVLRLLTATRERFGFGPDDVWPMFHSYAFDVSVWELWGALLHGGRLVIVPFDTARSPDDLMDLLVEQRVTVLNQTPGAFYRLVRLAAQDDPPRGPARAAPGDLRRRAAGDARPAPVDRPARPHRARPGQHVRHHRDDRARHPLRGDGTGPRTRRGVPRRAAHRRPVGGAAGRARQRRAARRDRRDLRGRRGRRPRLPRPARADRAAVRARPVRPAGLAALPQRRPRAAAAGRRPRIPGPHRRPGEDPRLPGRAGRDPGPAAGRRPAARRRGRGPRGRAGRGQAHRVRRAGRPRRLRPR